MRPLGGDALGFHHLLLDGLRYFWSSDGCLLRLVLCGGLECFVLVLGMSTATLDKIQALSVAR